MGLQRRRIFYPVPMRMRSLIVECFQTIVKNAINRQYGITGLMHTFQGDIASNENKKPDQDFQNNIL